MITEPIKIDNKANKKTRRRTKFVVKLDGVSTGFLACPRFFGPKLVPRRGVLVKNTNNPTYFGGIKSADAAAMRAIRLRNALNNAVFLLPNDLRQFAVEGSFTVEPVNL